MRILEAARESCVGVLVDAADGSPGGAWLRPAPWIAVSRVDVEPNRKRVVEVNAWITRAMNIDYGHDGGLCGGIEAQQERLVESVLLGKADLRRGRGYEFDGRAKVLAGPGAVYHVDEGVGAPTGLFVITALTGEAVLDLPEMGLKVSFEPGVTVIFDSLQVHGLTAPGGGGIGVTPFVVVTRTAVVDTPGASRMGLMDAMRPAGGVDLGASQVEAATGRVMPAEDE